MNPDRTLDGVKVEAIVEEGLNGGNYHGHVLWQAPSHARIHRYAFYGSLSPQRRQFGNQFVRRPPGVADELLHHVHGRGHYR